VPFDVAARRALRGEADTLSLRDRLAEWLIHRVTPNTSPEARTDALHPDRSARSNSFP
jgi:hypothetical protein